MRRRLELEGELLVGQGSPPIPAANLARIEANLAAPDLVAVRADLIQISRKVAAPDVDLSAPERWALDVSGYLSSREMAGLLAEDRATLDQSTGTTRRAKAEEARESTRSAGKRRVRVLRKIGAL
ncbi:MAG: hypothetical protein NT062_10920 [Proteobacteria bacterium]|nr:hypothetical protein [Pseudomonadota bacterium]